HRVRERRAEALHQFVFEREVEATFAGISLTTGATAQLVVDATRLVALGSEDVEPADLADLVSLLFDALLGVVEDLVPGRLVLLRVLLRIQSARLHLGDRE